MSIDLKCPQCGSELDVPDTAAGKRARCPDCGAVADVPLPVSDKEAADILLAGDAGGAIAAAPAGATVTRTPPPEEEPATTTPRRRSPVAAPALLKPPRNGPARVGSAFALLSLVPGLALLFGPLALVLGLVGLIVGRFKGMARGTRDVVAAVGIGLLTTAGNWGLALYVLSVLGPDELVEKLFDPNVPPPPRLGGFGGGPDLGFGPDPEARFPHHRDPFAEPEDKPNPARRKSLQVGEEGFGAVFSADGKRAVILHRDKAELWELESERHRPFAAGGRGILAFSPDGRWIAVAGEDDLRGPFRVYDWDTGECRKTVTADAFAMPGPGPNIGFSSRVAFSADGSVLAYSNSRGVRLWRTSDWEELTTGIRGDFFSAEGMALSPDGSTLAVGIDQPFARGLAIVLWDTRQGKQKGSLDGGSVRLVGMKFAPDGKSLASADWEEVQMWDVARRSVVWSAARDRFAAAFGATLVFSPDGRLFASRGRDGELVLTEVATGKRVATVGQGRQDAERYGAVGFGAGGDTLLLATNKGAIETWDVAELIEQGPRFKPPAR